MQSRRPYLLALLETADSESLAKYRKTNKILDNASLRARIFDEFPILLPDMIIEKLGIEFRQICEAVKSVRVTDKGLEITRQSDINKINAWVLKVIDKGMIELLDSEKKINSELAAILHWRQHLNPQEIAEILCSYVNNINQAMVKYTGESSINTGAVWNYITQHYRSLIDKRLCGQQAQQKVQRQSAKQQSLTSILGIPIAGILMFSPPQNRESAKPGQSRDHKRQGITPTK